MTPHAVVACISHQDLAIMLPCLLHAQITERKERRAREADAPAGADDEQPDSGKRQRTDAEPAAATMKAEDKA